MVIRTGAYFPRGSGVAIKGFSCRGNEKSLINCTRSFAGIRSHYDDVGVECEGG